MRKSLEECKKNIALGAELKEKALDVFYLEKCIYLHIAGIVKFKIEEQQN